MTIDPTRMEKEDIHQLQRAIAEDYGIGLYRQYSESEAAGLLLSPAKRRAGAADVSTLKRKRRSGKIPHVPLGDGSIAYLGRMLCDFIAFGERSVLLWGSGEGDSTTRSSPNGSAPHRQDGGQLDAMEAQGGFRGSVHQA